MTAILDTSFLLATTNTKDRNHNRVLTEPLILPVSVIPEVCYLIATRLGYRAMRQFLKQLIASNTILESITTADLQRVTEILDTYIDSQLDFVDATIVAIAERRNITQILTLDRRDFTISRPKHCPYFEILP